MSSSGRAIAPSSAPPSATFLHSFDLHGDAVNDISVIGSDLISASADGSHAVVDLNSASVIKQFTADGRAECISRIKREACCFWSGYSD